MTERGLQPTSIARRLGILRSLTATMRRFGLPWDLSHVRGPSYSPYARATGPETHVLEEKLDELEARAFSPEERRATLLDARDYAILVVLYHTAMRRDSLVRLTWGSMHLRRKRPYAVTIVKGGKTRRFPLSLRCETALLRWRDLRVSNIGRVRPADHVFCGISGREQGKPLSADAVYKRTKYAHGLSGPHGIRHTAATTVFERSKGDLRLASDILGHANAATTQSYMDKQGHAAEEAMRLLSGEDPQ
jgi:site-specific recombinase XerC